MSGGEAGDAELGGGGQASGARPQRSGIHDFDEEEAAGGCGGAGGGAVAGGEDVGDGVGGDAAGAGLDEGADEVADHVVEEAGAGDAVDEEVVVVDARRSGGWCGWRRVVGFGGFGGRCGW